MTLSIEGLVTGGAATVGWVSHKLVGSADLAAS